MVNGFEVRKNKKQDEEDLTFKQCSDKIQQTVLLSTWIFDSENKETVIHALKYLREWVRKQLCNAFFLPNWNNDVPKKLWIYNMNTC